MSSVSVMSDRSWVLRAQWVVAVVALGLHAWITWGAYFHNDDFLYLVWAQESFVDALTRVYNNHLMPLEFAIVWASQWVAPLSWPLAAAVLTGMWGVVLAGVVLVMRRAFGTSLWTLVVIALIGLGPLPAAVSTWYASGLQFLPWTAGLVWMLYFAIRDAQSPGRLWWLACTATYVVSLGFWQKGLLAAPVVLWLSWRYWPGSGRWGLKSLGKRWLLPAGLGVASVAYVPVYLAAQQSDVLPAAPSLSDLVDIVRVTIGEVLIPSFVGMPWGVFAESIDGHTDPNWPWWGSFLLIEAALGLLLISVVRWRPAWNAWTVMLGYAVVTIALYALGRSHVVGLVLAYDARYVEDLYVVVALCLPFAFVRPRGSSLPSPPDWPWGTMDRHRAWLVGAAIVGVNALVLPSVSLGMLWRENPGREFMDNVMMSVEANPDATFVDRKLPSDVMAELFLEDANLSRVLSAWGPAINWNGSGASMYAFDDQGRSFEPVIATSAISVPGLDGGCGYRAVGEPTAIELDSNLFTWIWIGRMEYLAAEPGGEASVALDGDAVRVPLQPGLNDVYFVVVGGGDTLTFTPPPGSGVCVASVALGQVDYEAAGGSGS